MHHYTIPCEILKQAAIWNRYCN